MSRPKSTGSAHASGRNNADRSTATNRRMDEDPRRTGERASHNSGYMKSARLATGNSAVIEAQKSGLRLTCPHGLLCPSREVAQELSCRGSPPAFEYLHDADHPQFLA